MSDAANEPGSDDRLAELLVRYDELRKELSGEQPSEASRLSAPGVAEALDEQQLRELAHCVDLLAKLRLTNPPHAETASSFEYPPQTSFGRYELREVRGRGAFGIVYRAYDEELSRFVAIKLPRAEVLLDEKKKRGWRDHMREACSVGRWQ